MVWQAIKKESPSLPHDLLTTEKCETNFFSRPGRRKIKLIPPSRMTFLAAVKSETHIILRLAWPYEACSYVSVMSHLEEAMHSSACPSIEHNHTQSCLYFNFSEHHSRVISKNLA